MLLTITYSGHQTQDLGYLLYKNPARPQSIELSRGYAHVFFPEISEERTTAALLLDLDPLLLAKGKPGTGEAGLFDYVNDRPYVASSFMSNAISRAFGTAMFGRCDSRPELVREKLDLTVTVTMLPVRGEKTVLCDFLEPLGYEVRYETFPVDEKFPEWKESAYVNLVISGRCVLSDMLKQLCVLIPAFDRQKHYFVTEQQITHLVDMGGEWLAGHPQREKIIQRYFSGLRSYAEETLRQIVKETVLEDFGQVFDSMSNQTEDGFRQMEDCISERAGTAISGQLVARSKAAETFTPLNTLRLRAVFEEIIKTKPDSVLDLGCGEGRLLKILLEESRIPKIAGTDVSVGVLKRAEKHLNLEKMPEREKERLSVFQGSLLYRDERFLGYDTVSVVEVVEHMDVEKLPVFEEVLFGYVDAGTILVTTPNREYNAVYGLETGELRHSDHRFEWTSSEFHAWAGHICEKYGFSVEFKEIGEKDGMGGFPTEMGVFRR